MKDKLNKIKKLVARFEANETDYCSSSSTYNETEVRNDFINEFFNILGWDVTNKKGLPKPLREVVLEANVGVDEKIKKPDYEFRLKGVRKFFVEAKKPSLNIFTSKKSVYQAKRYGWSANLSISVLTNFNQLSIYETSTVPKEGDDVRIARLYQYDYREYVEKFEEICNLLSRDSIISGFFDKKFKPLAKEKRGIERFDDYFLKQIEHWRVLLAKDIIKNNSKITENDLNYLIQTFINRIVFLRICEDRSLEKYGVLQNLNPNQARKELLALFYKADKRYDSGLFNFVMDKLTPSIIISDEVLLKIVSDLYYPNSPYTFSVVDPKILGDIYEQFLAKKIVKKNNKIILETKPEIKLSNGIFTTPHYVTRYIVDKTLGEKLGRTSSKEIGKLKIADISCGSGIFLVETYDHLLKYYLNYYHTKGISKKLYKDDNNDYFLNLKEKKNILLNHIYGLDIDEQAVEVAKFSLSVKLLEEMTEGEFKIAVQRGEKILPSLEKNILCGNSLVDKNYLSFRGTKNIGNSELDFIRPFDWENFFGKADKEGTFDIIIGNPPYIKIQNMVSYAPLEVNFYKSKESLFVSAKSDNFDKYQLFVEKAIGLLKNNGYLGYIIPNKFTVTKAGRTLRSVIANNRILRSLTHFGQFQIFEHQATTYSSIIVLEKSKLNNFEFNKVNDLEEWKTNPNKGVIIHKEEVITEKPWIFPSKQEKEMIETIEKGSTETLDSVAEIFVGLQTSADKTYIIERGTIRNRLVEFLDLNNKTRLIERSILKDCILDKSVSAFEGLNPNRYIIFPYKKSDGIFIPLEESEFISTYPKAYKYLHDYKGKLSSRNMSKDLPWYLYGRSQSLNKFDQEKIIIKNPALSACAVYDENKILFTGGGNGPYYGIRPRENKISIIFLLALLNHPLFDRWVKLRSSIFRGGYYSFGKQFMSGFPLFDISKAPNKQIKEVEECWHKIIELNKDRSVNPNRVEILKKRKSLLKKEADLEIFKLYKVNSSLL